MSRSRKQGTLWLTALLVAFGHGCVIPLSTPNTPADASPDGGSMMTGPGDAPEGAAMSTGWTNVTDNLAGMSAVGCNMQSVFVKPDEDLLIAGISGRGLWGSRDGGGSWQAMSSDAGAGNITNRPTSLVFDPQNPARFWESGIYDGPGVFVTMDDGNTFSPLGNVMHCDSVSVDFSDPNRQTLVAGGHEAAKKLSRSTDGGMTWTDIYTGLPPNSSCTFPLVLSAQSHLVGCGAYNGGPTGIYQTADGGGTWNQLSASGGAGAPLLASDGSMYWASPGGRGLTRSTDNGQHWSDVGVAANVISSVHPIELPDGRLATLGAQRTVVVSADHGASWKSVSTVLPYADAVGLVYSKPHKAFYIWHFTCEFSGSAPVPADAIMSFAFDYERG
jgi:photosystem II stability/assembly factor-like uncharacterized protein